MTNTTSVQILTKAGEELLARLAAEEKELVIDKYVFADVPERPDFPQREDGVPTDYVVHESIIHEKGRLNANSVIYSSTLASDVGPFHFNWSGLYCSEHDVLVTIHYPQRTPKTADLPGVAGNTLVRSQVLQYTGVADITNITVDASSWQYNADPRMKKMDSDSAQAIVDQNGKDWFIEGGFLVTPQSTAFKVAPGAGYVSGHRVTLEFERFLQVPVKPSFIYIDAYREGTPTGEWVTTFNFVVSADEKDDYLDAQGLPHYVVKIAQVMADGTVADLRPEGGQEATTKVISSFVSISKQPMNCGHIVTRGFYMPGDKGNAEFAFTGNEIVNEAGKSYLNIGLVYDANGREFEIISSPLNYRQFGAILDGQSTVMRQIKDCHDCANLKKLPVVNEDGIALIDDSYLAVINTNVDWGMTEFVIHEDVGRPATWDFPVLFRAEGNPLSDFQGVLNHADFYETSSHVASLSSLHNAYVFIESDLEHIKRKPESTTFIYKKEPNRVVKNGELNKPLRFDYSGATSLSVKYRNLEESYITIKGGFIDLNRSPSHVFLDIARNNTIWELIGFKDKTQSDELNIRATMKITHAADIRLINVNGEAPTRLEGTEGTYGLSGNGIVDLQMENINGYCGWGFSGFNNINGLSLKSSKINRIDCHFGLWDFYAEDTHFKEWGVMVGSGGGYLKLKNCSRFFGKSTKLNASQYGYKSVVQFRPDYGAEWRGNIDIDGLTLVIDSKMPVTDKIKIVDFVSSGDYGAQQITEWGRNINIHNVVINAPDSHLNRHEFGVVCVDYNKYAITTGVRLPARIVVDNVNYSKENANAYISAVNGPNDKHVKMPVESASVLSGAHNSVWCISRIFNANRNPFHDDGIPGAETLIQYDPIPDDRNINSDKIKLRVIITNCTMFDVEVTVDHLIEVHGGSCISYDANSGGLVSEGEAWFYGSQIIPLPSRTSGNADFSHHHLRDCTIVKTATQYIPTKCLSSKGTLVEKGATYDFVSPIDLFHGYVQVNERFEDVS